MTRGAWAAWPGYVRSAPHAGSCYQRIDVRAVFSSRRLHALAAYGCVWLVACWVLWPVPLGHMPVSADHTVHLTRIYLWGEALARGQLRDWSPVWFFGTPIGELYPVLGDACVLAVKALSLGIAKLTTAYAWAFTLVFALQGAALVRVSRVLGWGYLPGALAGVLVLTDAGAYREGGFIYTVTYGVWPQALSTSLSYLAMGELLAVRHAEGVSRQTRALILAAFATAGAILAHPMALPLAVMGSAVAMVVVRTRLFAVHAALVMALGLSLAAWWLVPMLAHRFAKTRKTAILTAGTLPS